MVFNKITELFTKLKDGEGNAVTSTDLGDGKRGLDVSFASELPSAVIIRDATDPDKKAIVDANGRVYVDVQAIPDVIIRDKTTSTYKMRIAREGRQFATDAIPGLEAGQTLVAVANQGAISGYQYQDSHYVIPAGKILYIQRFIAGCQEGSSTVQWFLCPTGAIDYASIQLTQLYINGFNDWTDVSYAYTGNGVMSIGCRIRRLSFGKRFIGAVMMGYRVDS